jgi:hypothetical protein
MSQVDRSADQRPGEVCWVKCRNPLEDRTSIGKWRPMVLVRRVGASWMAVGLTSRSHYASGVARVAVIQPRWAGLRGGPSFIWGENLTRVDALDIGDHIGWAHPELLGQIKELVRLNAADRDSLGFEPAGSEPQLPGVANSGHQLEGSNAPVAGNPAVRQPGALLARPPGGGGGR